MDNLLLPQEVELITPTVLRLIALWPPFKFGQLLFDPLSLGIDEIHGFLARDKVRHPNLDSMFCTDIDADAFTPTIGELYFHLSPG